MNLAKTQGIFCQTVPFLECEIFDILLATIGISFLKSFEGRDLPTIFTEGHGREPWSSELDCARTVGWFTTLYPLFLQVSERCTISDAVRRAYQARKEVSRNGFDYFSSQFLRSERKPLVTPSEILFNYEGMYQQLERSGALFHIDAHSEGDRYDISANMMRLAVIDIAAAIKDNEIQISWAYPANISRPSQIQSWSENATAVLEELANFTEIQSTHLSDPLPLSLSATTTYAKPYRLVPASSSQNSMLFAQRTGRPCYAPRLKLIIRSARACLELDRFERAWTSVQNRHSILKTIFLLTGEQDSFDQLVLRSSDSRTYKRSSLTREQETIEEFLQRCEKTRQPPHEIIVEKMSDNEILCIWTVSHTLIDQVSMRTVWRDLSNAYDGNLLTPLGPQFASLSSLEAEKHAFSTRFWQSYLKNVQPCRIQAEKTAKTNPLRDNVTIPVAFSLDDALLDHCTTHSVLSSAVFQLAWALTLEKYLSRHDVVFGVVVSGRELDIDHIDEIVGPVMSILPFRVSLYPEGTAPNMLRHVQATFFDCLPHQRTGLARHYDADHGRFLSASHLFDTALNYRQNEAGNRIQGENQTLEVEIVEASDPYDFAAVVEVDKYHDHTEVALVYWTDLIADHDANDLAEILSSMIEKLLKGYNGQGK